MWCFDRWYTVDVMAMSMRDHYVDEGAEPALVVIGEQGQGFGVLYFADEPFADWHTEPR